MVGWHADSTLRSRHPGILGFVNHTTSTINEPCPDFWLRLSWHEIYLVLQISDCWLKMGQNLKFFLGFSLWKFGRNSWRNNQDFRGWRGWRKVDEIYWGVLKGRARTWCISGISSPQQIEINPCKKKKEKKQTEFIFGFWQLMKTFGKPDCLDGGKRFGQITS